MQFGIAIPTAADSWRLVRRAEELGFSHAWFFDTQMLSADPFVAMAAAAMKTTRIKLGTGVLIPSNRIAPVAANAFASLNKLAPGRIVFGISTGFTGRRTMGLGAVKLADMEEYIRIVQALWRGETVEMELEGKRRPIRMLNPELGLINTHDPMPLFIAASGPRARAAHRETRRRLDRQRRRCRTRRRHAGTDARGLAASRPRARRPASGRLDRRRGAGRRRAGRWPARHGARRAACRHAAASRRRHRIGRPSRTARDAAGIRRSRGSLRRTRARQFQPKDAYYLSNHRGHLMFVRPDERPFITAEMIRRTSFIGTERDLKQRIAALADAGFTQVVFSIPPGQEHAIEDWGRIRRAFG